jgi:hypothetical protein
MIIVAAKTGVFTYLRGGCKFYFLLCTFLQANKFQQVKDLIFLDHFIANIET